MAKSVARLLLLAALAAALAGCFDDKPSQVNANLYPKDYKNEIIGTLRQSVFSKNETSSVADAFISEPALHAVGSGQLYVSCVRYTAHGTAFNVAANATRVAYFYGGHLNQLVPASADECAKAAYKPFPELDKVCVGTGCK